MSAGQPLSQGSGDHQASRISAPEATGPAAGDEPGGLGIQPAPPPPVPLPPNAPPSPARPMRDDGETAGKWTVLAIVAVGVFMSTLDSSIVNISLPAIARYFGVALSGAVEWIVIAYLVVIAAVLLTIGRLADLLGRKPIWACGLVIFTLGS